MNFFEHQELARRRTKILVLYFGLAVIGIVAALYGASLLVLFLIQTQGAAEEYGLKAVSFPWWNPHLFFPVAALTLAVIVFGTVFKMMQLSGGGKTVAEMLGGRLISPATDDPAQKKLLNVVEEMAIASGTSVPPVYLLTDEKAINAFAAGFSTRDAVIGVTGGALELLSRDELQGVIAHEFSHILNGDMRLNLRLMGILNGILILAFFGQGILRSLTYARLGSSRSRGRGGGAGAVIVAVFVMGAALVAVGYIGVFFGNLIKSAVSRQREFLADASAVQFTRLPDGLTGALKKIGGFSQKSLLKHPRTEEASHFYFSGGSKSSLAGFFATHPPLQERIRRLEPSFDGHFPQVPRPESRETVSSMSAGKGTGHPEVLPLSSLTAGAVPAMAEGFAPKAGSPDNRDLSYAGTLLQEIPESLRRHARDPYGARAVIYGLLLDKSRDEIRDAQFRHLFAHANQYVYKELKQISDEIARLDVRLRLPLIDLCLPSLMTLSVQQHEMFRKNVEALILADGRADDFELALKLVVFHHLDGFFGGGKPQHAVFRGEKGLEAAIHTLLSVLAYAGAPEEDKAREVFQKAAAAFSEKDVPELLGRQSLVPGRIEAALMKLQSVPFLLKEKIIRAGIESIQHDGKVLPQESEMIRAFADILDCPLPPERK